MKTTKQGNIKRHPGTWWIGKAIKCSNCRSEHVLEEGDNVDIYVNGNASTPRDETLLDIACPDCGMIMRIKHHPDKKTEEKKAA